MQIDELKLLLEKSLAASEVMIKGDARHLDLTIISEQFMNCRTIKRQQLVYGVLQEYIQRGDLHAINMKTYTEEEWEQQHG